MAMVIEMDEMPKEFNDVCAPPFVAPAPVEKKRIKLAKKVAPPVKEVAPPVKEEPVEEVKEEAKEEEVVYGPVEPVVDINKVVKECDAYIAENGGLIAFVAKYKEMIGTKEGSVVSKASKDPKHYTFLNDLDSIIPYAGHCPGRQYDADCIPYDKDTIGKHEVGDIMFGIRVPNRKREWIIKYKFKVLKLNKAGCQPVAVKDCVSGAIHKVNGGKIEIMSESGSELIYVIANVRSA